MNIRLAKKNREVKPDSWEALYIREVENRIRAKYTLNNELAILRQRDSKPLEFAEYNDYVEKCKAEVKAEMEVS